MVHASQKRLGLSIAAIAIAIGAALAAPPACAQAYSLTDPRVARHVLGNTQWTVLHWMSHAIIDSGSSADQGNMETTADGLATLLLLEAREIEPESAKEAIDTMLGLTGAVMSWVASAEETGDKAIASEPLTPWGGHHLSLERYRDVVCILYGADPGLFERSFTLAYAHGAGVPPDRLQECRDGYEPLRATWSEILIPFKAPPAEPGSAAQPGQATVEFQPASDPGLDEFRSLIQDAGMVTGLAARFNASQVLKHDIHIVFTECGATNSKWDMNERRITVCYELLGTFPRWSHE